MAFSTSEGSIIGGKGQFNKSSAQSMPKSSRSPHAHFQDVQNARTSSISCPTVEVDSRILGKALRRY